MQNRRNAPGQLYVVGDLVWIGFWLAACSAAFGACSDRSKDASPERVTIRSASLIDSVPYFDEVVGPSFLRRVAVTTNVGVDTLSNVLTKESPLVIGDTLLLGWAHEHDRIVRAFRYAAGREVRQLPLPTDFYQYSNPKFSPDGRYVAYMARDTAGLGYATVVTWPEHGAIYRGPPARLLETDVTVDAISWPRADSFEIRLELSRSVGGTQRIRGDVRGTATVDTVGR